jgi:hypothetical protein
MIAKFLNEIAAALESAPAKGAAKAKESADRSGLTGKVREIYVREYIDGHIRFEIRVAVDKLRILAAQVD